MYKFLYKDIDTLAKDGKFTAPSRVYRIYENSKRRYWIYAFLMLLFLIGFLPWTQNIRSKGYVTTLRQEDRPQEINTVIPGKVLKWYIKEGDVVNAGDTILVLGEVKMEYFDPKLIERTQDQIEAKNQGRLAYEGKASTAILQKEALTAARGLKLQSLDNKIGQQRLKIGIDSVDLIAARNAQVAYQRQYEAAKSMFEAGAISQTENEKRRVQYLDGMAKVNSLENKFSQSKQEFLNLKIEKNSVQQEYLDKLAKVEGERFASISEQVSAGGEILKLENILANYNARQELYVLRASQAGQVINAKKAGIGEMIKEGDNVAQIIPNSGPRAVELFVEPVDLPLVAKGQHVRFIFDGFPAIVFSGWPNGSFGTFGGLVSAVETSVSENGKFRVLVSEDPNDQKWPSSLKVGAGANGISLLKDVIIYYELWRNINGFPPDFYNKVSTKPVAK